MELVTARCNPSYAWFTSTDKCQKPQTFGSLMSGLELPRVGRLVKAQVRLSSIEVLDGRLIAEQMLPSTAFSGQAVPAH